MHYLLAQNGYNIAGGVIFLGIALLIIVGGAAVFFKLLRMLFSKKS